MNEIKKTKNIYKFYCWSYFKRWHGKHCINKYIKLFENFFNGTGSLPNNITDNISKDLNLPILFTAKEKQIINILENYFDRKINSNKDFINFLDEYLKRECQRLINLLSKKHPEKLNKIKDNLDYHNRKNDVNLLKSTNNQIVKLLEKLTNKNLSNRSQYIVFC